MGPHIFQTCPSANYFDCKAMSIGARSQSARTYLERCMDKFADCKFPFLALFTRIEKKLFLIKNLVVVLHALISVNICETVLEIKTQQCSLISLTTS